MKDHKLINIVLSSPVLIAQKNLSKKSASSKRKQDESHSNEQKKIKVNENSSESTEAQKNLSKISASSERKQEESHLNEQKKIKMNENSTESTEGLCKREFRPSSSVCHDKMNHVMLRDSDKSASRCKMIGCVNQYTHVFCKKCEVHLCFTSERNCFAIFHGQSMKENPLIYKRKAEPDSSVRYDNMDHFAFKDSSKSASVCKFEECGNEQSKRQSTHVFCAKCDMHLCFTKNRNCFAAFHTKNK